MAYDFPNTPAVDQVANGYKWNGAAWVGISAQAGSVTEQFFDVSGKATQDIPVPSWAKGCVIEGSVFNTDGTLYLRVSFDGTTFFAGATDYNNSAAYHNTGSAGYAAVAPATGNAIFIAGNGNASGTIAVHFQTQMRLVRPSASEAFEAVSYSKNADSGGTTGHRTYWYYGWPNTVIGAGALAIKALRIMPGAGSFTKSPSYVYVRWLGDPSAPVGPVVGDPQYFYAGTGSPGGTATQNNNLITVGMRFTPLVAGKITGVRWYNGAIESATDGKVAVYSDAGTKLIEQAFSGLSTAIGWRLVPIDYTIVANSTYRVAVWLKLGSDSHAYYMAQANKFASAGITVSGVMTMPVGPTQNVFFDSSNSDITFPTDAFNSSGYGVDVEFRTIT